MVRITLTDEGGKEFKYDLEGLDLVKIFVVGNIYTIIILVGGFIGLNVLAYLFDLLSKII